jgi:hypothetical protein
MLAKTNTNCYIATSLPSLGTAISSPGSTNMAGNSTKQGRSRRIFCRSLCWTRPIRSAQRPWWPSLAHTWWPTAILRGHLFLTYATLMDVGSWAESKDWLADGRQWSDAVFYVSKWAHHTTSASSNNWVVILIKPFCFLEWHPYLGENASVLD